MNKNIVLTSAIALTLLLTGCGNSSPKFTINGMEKGNLKTDSKGNYHLSGKAGANSIINYKYKNNSVQKHGSVSTNKNGTFNFNVSLGTYQKEADVSITSTLNHKKYSDTVAIINASSAYERRDDLDSIQESVYNLFSNSKHTELNEEMDSKSVSDVWEEVDTLPSSPQKDKLLVLVKRAQKLADKELEEDTKNTKASSSDQIGKAESDKNSTSQDKYQSKYKRVSLEDFTGNPDKYDQKLIKVTGNVTYIQRESDNDTMDYVVLSNADNSVATVTEIEVEDMHSHHISEGSNITVLGGGLTKTVKLNDHTLESDIIVDFIQ
ncbi:toxin Cry1Ac domain D-VI-related protein [Levilactobacillus andaensis]|uniref:toxin Cry1Ac domain D-VI-related protein n=1 Tax=Levilactobacillus andaensis TaxID=2799570 RepID=UPI001942AC71|nr:toxin Cry1Ac domain D-VI-related protein [Levilactobacillus andaensis]